MTAPRPTPLDPEAAPAGSTLTLVRGSTFCLSGTDGDIGGATHGLFARDTRVLSGLRLTADGRPPAPLGIVEREPDAAVLLGRLAPPRGRHDSVVLVERRRTLGEALTEDLTLHNFSAEAASTDLEVHVGADFADLFAVKDGRAWGRRAAGIVEPLQPSGGEAVEPLLRLCPDPSSEDAHSVDHDEGAPALVVAASGGARVRAGGIDEILRRCVADLEGLRIHLTGADRPALAAGAPWFMTLFGRDSLLAGYMALPLDPDLLTGALQALAARQGRCTDPGTEEQPGRILHELRVGRDSARAIGGHCYYGSVDATPLFVVMLAEACRWGLDPAAVARLLPHADAALAWCLGDGDSDGDSDGDGSSTTAV